MVGDPPALYPALQSSDLHPPHPTTLPSPPSAPPANLLVHPAGDSNEPGQGLEVEGLGTFF